MKTKCALLMLTVTITFLLIFQKTANTQTISSFENLILPLDSFWNGSDLSGAFQSGNIIFHNKYNTTYNIWESGFAYSDMKDTVTTGYTNIYSARTGVGIEGSANYGIGQDKAVLHLTGTAAGKQVNGFYVTNSNYAYFSLKNGDSFAKKFGGASGNDPDWFKLSITGYLSGTPISDTVHFYLADFRFSNNSQDYILKTWEWVDLSPLGDVDSLIFLLHSSDTGIYGMNTPPFFCLDNFTTADFHAGLNEYSSANDPFEVYPNPATGLIRIVSPSLEKCQLNIFDISGRMIISMNDFIVDQPFDISSLDRGVYFIQLDGDRIKKFLVQ
jgi:hypothetical protein